jgi:hypothetical protein
MTPATAAGPTPKTIPLAALLAAGTASNNAGDKTASDEAQATLKRVRRQIIGPHLTQRTTKVPDWCAHSIHNVGVVHDVRVTADEEWPCDTPYRENAPADRS